MKYSAKDKNNIIFKIKNMKNIQITEACLNKVIKGSILKNLNEGAADAIKAGVKAFKQAKNAGKIAKAAGKASNLKSTATASANALSGRGGKITGKTMVGRSYNKGRAARDVSAYNRSIAKANKIDPAKIKEVRRLQRLERSGKLDDAGKASLRNLERELNRSGYKTGREAYQALRHARAQQGAIAGIAAAGAAGGAIALKNGGSVGGGGTTPGATGTGGYPWSGITPPVPSAPKRTTTGTTTGTGSSNGTSGNEPIRREPLPSLPKIEPVTGGAELSPEAQSASQKIGHQVTPIDTRVFQNNARIQRMQANGRSQDAIDAAKTRQTQRTLNQLNRQGIDPQKYAQGLQEEKNMKRKVTINEEKLNEMIFNAIMESIDEYQFLGIGNPSMNQYQNRANRQLNRAERAYNRGNVQRAEKLLNKSGRNQALADAGKTYDAQSQQQTQDIAGQPAPFAQDKEEVMKFQTWAKQNKTYGGNIDGLWGPKSQAAWDAYCNSQAQGGQQ